MTFRTIERNGWDKMMEDITAALTRSNNPLETQLIDVFADGFAARYCHPRSALAWFRVMLNVMAARYAFTKNRYSLRKTLSAMRECVSYGGTSFYVDEKIPVPQIKSTFDDEYDF